MTSSDMQPPVLLSVQRGILGHIGSTVREITCRWTEDKIHLRAVFGGEINHHDAAVISEAETEVIADFPPEVTVHFKLQRKPWSMAACCT